MWWYEPTLDPQISSFTIKLWDLNVLNNIFNGVWLNKDTRHGGVHLAPHNSITAAGRNKQTHYSSPWHDGSTGGSGRDGWARLGKAGLNIATKLLIPSVSVLHIRKKCVQRGNSLLSHSSHRHMMKDIMKVWSSLFKIRSHFTTGPKADSTNPPSSKPQLQ